MTLNYNELFLDPISTMVDILSPSQLAKQVDNLKIVQADAMNMHYLTIVGHKFPEKKKKKKGTYGGTKKEKRKSRECKKKKKEMKSRKKYKYFIFSGSDRV